MLTKLDVSTAQGNLLSLQFDDEESPFEVQDIDGLDPVKATLTSSSFAGVDGEQYQSARLETRNVKIKLGLLPNPVTDTVRELRAKLYSFFMPKSEVTLTFYDDEGLTVSIVGRVETFESPLFTQEPTADISIICYDPNFAELAPSHLSGNTTSSSADTIVAYPGTAETGTVFTLNVNRALSEFTIYHQPPNDDLRTLDFSASLVAGDILTISSVTGDKGVTLNRGGSISSLLYGMSPQSSWIELMPGENRIRVYAEGAAIPYSVDYVVKYGGL